MRLSAPTSLRCRLYQWCFLLIFRSFREARNTDSPKNRKFFKGITNSDCEEPQICPPGSKVDTEEIGATDIQRPPKAQEPQKDHRQDYHTPSEKSPRKPPCSHNAEAPGNCSNEPIGPADSLPHWSRFSHGPRKPRPNGT
ncbi:hypothetical protein CRENBAI_001622 [Crenichthys baileyi]|uniref:Uncharacterized protein n=1 Tax=Crenichthys baileyi TaxID=28760 RepID=A0AAV9R246_9TELE